MADSKDEWMKNRRLWMLKVKTIGLEADSFLMHVVGGLGGVGGFMQHPRSCDSININKS